MADSERSLPQETVVQLKFILEKLFQDGRKWIRSIGVTDWRRKHYIGFRARRYSNPDGPSVSNIVEEIQPTLSYISKEASSEAGMQHSYIIVKPDNACLSEGGIALLRPVLKSNFSNEIQLNFHVWFHCCPSGAPIDHLMVGFRLEGPEGSNTTHDFFHAQPLRKFGPEEKEYGVHNRFPERFPTIPLPASNIVELCLTAVLVMCGKDVLRELVRNSGNADVRAAATAFWSKVFGNGGTAIGSIVSTT